MSQQVSQEAFYSSNNIGLVNCLLLSHTLICAFPNNECQVIFGSIKYPGGPCNWRAGTLLISKEGVGGMKPEAIGSGGVRDLGVQVLTFVTYWLVTLWPLEPPFLIRKVGKIITPLPLACAWCRISTWINAAWWSFLNKIFWELYCSFAIVILKQYICLL